MKKIIQFIALVTLVLQSVVSPMVVLAETIAAEPTMNPISLTSMEGKLLNADKTERLAEAGLENNEHYILQLKGVLTKESAETESIQLGLSSNFTATTPLLEVLSTGQESLGQGTVTGSTVSLAIAETISGTKEFVVNVPVAYHATPGLTTDALTVTSTLGAYGLPFNVATDEVIDPETATPEDVEEETEAEAEVEEDTVQADDQHEVAKDEAIEAEPVAVKEYVSGSQIDVDIIDEAIVTVSSNPATMESLISFELKWSFPDELIDNVEAGAYYEFQLPEAVTVVQEIVDFPLSAPGEPDRIIAYASVANDGKVRFVFTEEVENAEEISGFFKFSTRINEKIVTYPQDIVITIPVKGGEEIVTIPVNSKAEQSLEKQGRLNKNLNPDKIDWDVYVNKTKTVLTNLVVTDEIPAGLTLTDVEVYEIAVDFNGRVTNESLALLTAGVDYQVDVENGIVSVPGETNKAYRIRYKTSIDEDAKVDGGSVNFTNKVSATSDNNKELTAEATQTAKYGKLLVKDPPKYNQEKQTFAWHVKYNYGEKKILAGQASVVDEYSSNLKLIKESVKVVQMVADERGDFKPGKTLVEGTDYELIEDGTQFTIKFKNDVDYAVDITYETKVTDNTIISGKNVPVSNKISSDGFEGGGQTGTAKSNGLFKRATEVDYAKETITWTIEVNKDLYKMHNWKLVDTFPNKGLTFIKDTFKITEVDGEGTLISGTDYDLTDNGKGGFELAFKGKLNPTSSAFTITYETSFDKNDLDPAKSQFKNYALATWTDRFEKDHKNEAEASVKPKDETYNNGSKHGSYNAVTKEITWTVVANFNRDMLAKGQIVDPITGNQQYIAGSATLESFEVDKAGNLINTQKIDLPESILVTEDGKQLLKVDLPEQTDLGYRLVFKTSLVGQVVEDQATYTNIAKLFDQGVEKDTLTGKVSIANGGSFVTKFGKVDNPWASTKVTWEIMANPSQSTLEKFVIKDYPSLNQVIDGETVVITEMASNTNGKLSLTDKKLVLGQDYELVLERDDETGAQTMTISFNETIDKAYNIKYDADLMLASGDTEVTNRVEMSAVNKQTITQETKGKESVIHNDVGGGGDAVRTNFFVQKLSRNAAGKESPLAGVELEITNGKNNKVIMTKKTDEAGLLAVNGVTTGKYIIREIANPAGHFVSEEWAKGKVVTVTKENAEPLSAIKIINQLSLVQFKKVSEEGKPLPGAIFKLSKKNETGDYIADPLHGALTTNEAGLVVVEGLVAGDYRFEEVSAPTGYVRNETPLDFQLTGKETKTLVLPDMVNYQGSVSLVKTDKDNVPLAGAEFTLTSIEDLALKVVQTSDQDGKVTFTGLAPGNYTVTETKAPVGYSLNKTPQSFVIASTGTEKEVISLEALINYQGSAYLEKVTETGSPLAEAVFKVFDGETNEAVTEELVSDKAGKVLVPNLAPGTYYFKEVTAAPGYILNTETYSFTIAAEAQTEPEPVKAGDTGQAINYQGTAQFVKRDKAGNPLAGAEFKVTDLAGKDVSTEALVSDETGTVTVTGLAPGDYLFVEVKAPTGFVINSEKGTPFTIEASQVGKPAIVLSTDVVNYVSQAQLIKQSDDGKPLAGATFKVLDQEDTEVARDLVSDQDGLVSVSGLAAGHYRFIETAPAPGFMLNSTPHAFEIKAHYDGVPTIEHAGELINYRGSVTLVKESEAGKALADAHFALYDQDDQLITEVQTDQKGQLTVKDLAPGSYYFLETVAPTGFIKNTDKVAFEITDNATDTPTVITVKAINYQGEVSFNKVGETPDGQGLGGAVFDLHTSTGDFITQVTSEAETGRVYVGDLAPGDYVFTEVKAAPNYILNLDVLTFTIADTAAGKPAAEQLADFINYQGEIAFLKINGDLGQADHPGSEVPENDSLEGATFVLIPEAGSDDGMDGYHPDDIYTTDKEGVVRISQLAPGSYTLKEISAPTGFITRTQEVKFVIPAEYAGNPGNHYDLNTRQVFANYKGTAELIKEDSQGNALADAIFNVLNEAGEVVQSELRSNEEGKVLAKDLAPGDYFFQEVSAPNGYILNETQVAFTIDAETTSGRVAVTGLNLVNYQGEATLTKVTEDQTPLEGAVFALYLRTEAEDTLIAEDLVSNEAGEINVADLVPGNYYFKETQAPTGYILNERQVDFTIDGSSENGQISITDLSLVNYQGEATLTKVAADHTSLEGAVFALYLTTESEDTLIAEDLVSNEAGEINVADLAPGTYYFKETQAPTGYILDERHVDFTIDENSENGQISVTDLSLVNYQGDATLTKVAEDQTPLEGAVFALYLTTEAGDTLIAKDLVSDETGKINVADLAPGTYYFKETQAPTGYILNSELYDFTIEASLTEAEGQTGPETVTVEAINYQGAVILTKVDHDDTTMVLANATFNLVDQAGTVIEKDRVTDEAGQISVSGLAPGTYYFVETAAPTGYDLDETPVEVVIAAEAVGKPEGVTVSKANRKTVIERPKAPVTPKKPGASSKQDLPQASSHNQWSLIALGGTLTSLVVYFRRRKSKA